jgi:hypothetical protein
MRFEFLRKSGRSGIVAGAALLSTALLNGCNSQNAAPDGGLQVQQELQQLRESNQELQRLVADNQELPRLRRDNDEVHRLRAQTQDLPKLRQDNEQLRAQLQAIKGPKSRP